MAKFKEDIYDEEFDGMSEIDELGEYIEVSEDGMTDKEILEKYYGSSDIDEVIDDWFCENCNRIDDVLENKRKMERRRE